jgi:hopene-associated glycosyltransferase HpnB
MACGLRAAAALRPDYLFFSDADIEHGPAALAESVAVAESGGCDLVSRMVRLHCRSFAERALAPAFVFFFFKLYPPLWTADPGRATAGAAGGSLLVGRAALERIGGMEAIRGAVIDDCALARAVKRAGGRLWLGLAPDSLSLREYPTPGAAAAMIARTAYTQLLHSPLVLAGTVLGMFATYLAPPLAALALRGPGRWAGAAAWLLMSIAYAPALRFYGRSLLWAPFLPAAAAFYTAATVQSAVNYYRGRGAEWKGRVNLRTS